MAITEPLRAPRILAEPKRFGPLKQFSCGRQGAPWERKVNDWAKELYRGLKGDQTVLVLEDADRKLIGICSYRPQQLVAGTPVGSNAQRIHMIGTDRRYRGERLNDGSRPGDVLMGAALEQIKRACGGMPAVSALVSSENDRSHALFRRHGFRQLPYVGEGELILLRPPDKRFSLTRLKLLRATAT